MKKRRVVVKGGGENLFRIYERNNSFSAYKIKVGFITDSEVHIGNTKSLEDALSLIRSYSGREIQSIS